MAMSENTNDKKENQELGALWKKESKNGGQKYLAGHITVEDDMGVESKIKVVVFANRDKKNERYPDFRILKAREFQTAQKTEDSPVTKNEETVDEDIL